MPYNAKLKTRSKDIAANVFENTRTSQMLSSILCRTGNLFFFLNLLFKTTGLEEQNTTGIGYLCYDYSKRLRAYFQSMILMITPPSTVLENTVVR